MPAFKLLTKPALSASGRGGRIFSSFLMLYEAGEDCGLVHSYPDPADGPAVFVQLFGSVPDVALILLMAIIWDPPPWIHIAVAVPVPLITTVLPLRPPKALVARQFYFKARQGGQVR